MPPEPQVSQSRIAEVEWAAVEFVGIVGGNEEPNVTSLTATADTSELALATRGLRKAYGKQLAVAGLDLSVPKGIVYGFLGPNGAGKTTTMRMLTGLIEPDQGQIHIMGKEFSRGNRTPLYEVGALVESTAFYPFLSGRRNLLAFAATGKHPPKGRVDELLEMVGLLDRANDKVEGYSLGMKQRLGIAAALLNDPKLLLLDEPSNGLDPAGIVAMRELLRELAASGKTVFVSSHILGEVRMMVDVVGIISAGELVREGPIEELLDAEAMMRVRVAPDEAATAATALTALQGPEAVEPVRDEPGWFNVAVHPDRGSDIARVLVEAGIYPMAIETGSELEELFLNLTAAASDRDRVGFGVAGAKVEGGGDA
jgi:ABC-type multidrug transport system ATPase subunit